MMAAPSPKRMTIAIVYDESGNMYHAGETVTGHVVLQVQETVTLGGVRIYFHGKGRISWNTLANVNTAREIYLSEAQEILDTTNSMYTSLNLIPGIYRYPFSLRLPADLPASYKGSHGYIHYGARATVDGPWKTNQFCVESDFLVCRSVDLNLEPAKLRAPVQMQKEMNLTGGCCRDGFVTAEFVVNRRCFVPGEKVLLNGSVEYMTNARVKRTMVAIVQKITLCKYPKKHELRRTVSKVNGPSVAPYERGLWEDVELVVPFVPTSRMNGSNLIDIKYWIEIFVDFTLPCANISRKLTSIIIGNIPLRSPAQSRTTQGASLTTPTSETTTTTQRLEPRDHRPETDAQRSCTGSWGTQWDMVRWMSPVTTDSEVTESDTRHQSSPGTVNTHSDHLKGNGDCSFPLTSIHNSTIADIHQELKLDTKDDH